MSGGFIPIPLMENPMTLKTTFAIAMMAMLAAPTVASAQAMDSAMEAKGAMAPHDDKMMAKDQAMAPMSAKEKAMMAKCAKMKPAKAAKNAMCAKMAMKHDGKM
jgi:hypothetical protein